MRRECYAENTGVNIFSACRYRTAAEVTQGGVIWKLYPDDPNMTEKEIYFWQSHWSDCCLRKGRDGGGTAGGNNNSYS